MGNHVPEVARRLEDEVNVAMRDGAIDNSQARSWQSGITMHSQWLRELVQVLEQPDETDSTELVQHLTQVRHGLRDFQRDILDEVMVALSGVRAGVRMTQQYVTQGEAGARDSRNMRN